MKQTRQGRRFTGTHIVTCLFDDIQRGIVIKGMLTYVEVGKKDKFGCLDLG